MKTILISLLALALSTQAHGSPASNRETVLAFYDLALNQHQPEAAVKRYIGDHYIQHNPRVPDGKQAFVDFFKQWQQTNPTVRSYVKRVIAQGDLVVLHVHSKLTDDDRGRAIMDIFRLENGKIVEHWDVIQPIPETSANNNTMF